MVQSRLWQVAIRTDLIRGVLGVWDLKIADEVFLTRAEQGGQTFRRSSPNYDRQQIRADYENFSHSKSQFHGCTQPENHDEDFGAVSHLLRSF